MLDRVFLDHVIKGFTPNDCQDHCTLLGREVPDVPTDLREFLKFCGAKANGMSMEFV